MDIKPRPNRRRYIEVLRRMSPEERLKKAFELGEFTRSLFKQGLRERFPDKSEAEIHEIYVKRMAKCHNRNY